MPAGLVDALDPMLQRLVARTLPGDRRAVGVGAGTELAQLRPYVVGDDVRHIDPAASARTAEPHVRLHVPDQALTSWLLIDVSSSMAFGTEQRLKADVAEGSALVLGRLGMRRAGRVGAIAFGAGTARVLPPRGSRPALVALRRLLAEGVAADGHHDPGALADALVRLRRISPPAGLLAVISDFRDQRGWEGPLGALRARHSVLAIEVSDPRELELVPIGRLALIDPESGERIEIDTSRPRVRERFAAIERERREALAGELRRLRIAHVALSSGEDWLLELGRRLR
jgi:uncharacterized protein (DUF58 family)